MSKYLSGEKGLMIHYLKEDEIAIVMKACKCERDKMIIQFLLNTGLRIAECCGLKPSDIQGRLLTVRREIAKTGVERQIPLNNSAYKAALYFMALAELNKSTELMPVGYRGIEYMIDRVSRGLNLSINLTPHKLRHTFGHLLIKNGVPTRIVQVLLGHASLSSTEIYTGVDRETIENAVGSMDKVMLKCLNQKPLKSVTALS